MRKWRGRAAALLSGYVDSCDVIRSAPSEKCFQEGDGGQRDGGMCYNEQQKRAEGSGERYRETAREGGGEGGYGSLLRN